MRPVIPYIQLRGDTARKFALTAAGLPGRIPADFLLLLLLFGLTLFFYRDAILYGRIPYEKDTIIYYYPAAEYMSRVLTATGGIIPIWTDKLFGGYPIFADGEIGMLFPLNYLLLRLLPVETAFVWGIVLRTYLAAIFTYAYCRSTGMARFGALIAGIVFAFGGWMVAQTHHSNVIAGALWLPLMLCFFERALHTSGVRRHVSLVFAGAAFGLSCLGMHPQPVAMNALAFGAYAGFRLLFTRLGDEMPLPDEPPAGLEFLSPFRWRFVGRRFKTGAWWIFKRLALLVETAIVVPAVGIGLAAMQLLPEAELATFSFRGQLINGTTAAQSFTGTYALPPAQAILTLFLPRFFTSDTDTIHYWGLWAQWEGYHYIGLLPLLLAILATVLVRNRYTLLWLIMGLAAAILAAGPYIQPSPQAWIWNNLPVLAVLRAPARFMMITAFGGAVLAGWGAHLMARLPHMYIYKRWATGAWLALLAFLLAYIPTLLENISTWLLLDRHDALQLIQEWYTSLDTTAALSPAVAYYHVQESISLSNEHVSFALALLWVSMILLGATYLFRHRIVAPLWRSGMIAVICIDLFVAGHAFHPTVAIGDIDRMVAHDNAEMAAPEVTPAIHAVQSVGQVDEHGAPLGAMEFIRRREAGLQQDERIMVVRSPDGATQAAEPNRTLGIGLATVSGYVSLPPARLNEYTAAANASGDTLIDLWNVRYIVKPNRYVSLPSYRLTSFHPEQPLAVVSPGNHDVNFTFILPPVWSDEVRIVAALSDADNIPQGRTVALLHITDVRGEEYDLPLRAGIEVAEWAIDRPDVAAYAKHQRPEIAFDYNDVDGSGKPYKRHLYYAALSTGNRIPIKQIQVEYLNPTGTLHLYGLSVVAKSRALVGKKVVQVRDRTKYRLLYSDDDALVYENGSPVPRVFLVPSALPPVQYGNEGYKISMTTTSPDADRGRPILQSLMDGGIDAQRQVALEIPAGSGIPFLDSMPQVQLAQLPERQLWNQNAAITGTLALSQAARLPTGTNLGTVRITDQQSDRTSLVADTSRPAMLVLADTYYPGWHVYVDGKESILYRADYLYRAVYVPEGNHTIEFVYAPRSVIIGGWISVATGSGVILTCLLAFVLEALLKRRAAIIEARAYTHLQERFKQYIPL